MKKVMFFAFLMIAFSCDPPIRSDNAILAGNRVPLDTINIGTGPNTGTGEPIRNAFIKINEAIRTIDEKVGKGDSLTGAAMYATDHRADLIESVIYDTTTFEVQEITDVVIIHVGDTSVTALTGRIVFKTSDKHFYGCKQTNTSYKKWFQLDN